MLLRGFVIFGGGETIGHVADLDLSEVPELDLALAAEEPALGWKYEHFSIFFLDLWTGSGTFVLYDRAADDAYVPLDDDEVRTITGREPSSLGKPLLYHVPLGWVVLGVLLCGFGVVWWRNARELP